MINTVILKNIYVNQCYGVSYNRTKENVEGIIRLLAKELKMLRETYYRFIGPNFGYGRLCTKQPC